MSGNVVPLGRWFAGSPGFVIRPVNFVIGAVNFVIWPAGFVIHLRMTKPVGVNDESRYLNDEIDTLPGISRPQNQTPPCRNPCTAAY
jgi:hypothetical protein